MRLGQSQDTNGNVISLRSSQIDAVNISTYTNQASSFTTTVTVYNGCPTGGINFQVMNADQGESNIIYSTFTVGNAPTFISLSTTSANLNSTSLSLGQGATQQIYVFGSGFQSTNTVSLSSFKSSTTIDFGNLVSTTAYTYFGPSSFTITVKVDPNATLGGSVLTITNPDGGYCTQSGYFSVIHTPDVDHISPSIISAGISFTTVTVYGKGAYFEQGFQFWFSTSANGLPRI